MIYVSFRGIGNRYKRKTMVPPPISPPAHLAASLQLGLRQRSLSRNQQNTTVRYNLHPSVLQGPNTHTHTEIKLDMKCHDAIIFPVQYEATTA